MTNSFTRALAVCALAAASAAPAFAANDLTGTTVNVDWQFPTAGSNYESDSVVVGAGPEIQCAGNNAGTGLCAGFIDAATIDIGSNTLSLTIDAGSASWTGSAFNGYVFSNLSAGGNWTGYSFATTFAGLDASDVSFTPDAVSINLQGVQPTAGESFTITLIPSAVPEPGNLALMLAGVGALASIARRRRA